MLVPDTEMRIVSTETGRDVERTGDVGEVWLRGPQVMKGYANPQDSAGAFSPDGFFKTGDLGCVDEDGRLYIKDHLKELIKVKGYQVAPAEIEQVLLGHEFVSDAIVIGVAAGEHGTEQPKAHVVLNAAAVERAGLTGQDAVIEKALCDHVVQQLSHYKQLSGGVRFVPSVPKSVTGKLLRRVVRDSERTAANERA